MINILFFGQLRERLKTSKLSFELDTAEYQVKSVADLRSVLQNKDTTWQECLVLGQALAAVNQEFSPEDKTIESGDEVAFFPPVTGG